MWAGQRKDEVLLDIDDVAAGHVTKQRRNPADQWQWSREPAHDALVSTDQWQAVQDIFAAGTRAYAPKRRRNHDYMLKGMITCNACGRKPVAKAVRGRLQYRCRMRDEYPGIEHPRSLVREDHLLPTIDGWLGQIFDDVGPEGYWWCRRGDTHPKYMEPLDHHPRHCRIGPMVRKALTNPQSPRTRRAADRVSR